MNQHESEVGRGERFEFGKNWANFLKLLDDRRIRRAEESLLAMLELPNLQGKTFLLTEIFLKRHVSEKDFHGIWHIVQSILTHFATCIW